MEKEKRNFELPNLVIDLLSKNKQETDQSLSGALSAAVFAYVHELSPIDRAKVFVRYKEWLSRSHARLDEKAAFEGSEKVRRGKSRHI